MSDDQITDALRLARNILTVRRNPVEPREDSAGAETDAESAESSESQTADRDDRIYRIISRAAGAIR